MIKDEPIIERIRRVRGKIAEECDFDITKLIKHYQEEGKKTTRKFLQKVVKADFFNLAPNFCTYFPFIRH
jgi:hypothetical protein